MEKEVTNKNDVELKKEENEKEDEEDQGPNLDAIPLGCGISIFANKKK